MKIILTYNYLIEGESQDPKAIETQENKALEMVTKDHLQLVATSYVPPALQKVFFFYIIMLESNEKIIYQKSNQNILKFIVLSIGERYMKKLSMKK